MGVEPEFESWYHAEYQKLVNSVALAVGDRMLAAEAVAEAFTRALARWERVGRLEHRTGWVYRVAVNYAKRTYRRRSHERRLLVEQAAMTPLVVAPVETDHELWEAVAALPDRMRTIVILRYVADLTEPAIASTLGVRRGTVATTLRRARQRLAHELEPTPPQTRHQELTDAVHH